MRKTVIYSGIFLLLILGLVSCREKTPPPPETPASPSYTSPPSAMQTAPLQSGDTYAVMQTNLGTITIKLFATETPETVKNFVELSKKGFYNGLTFHRVMDDFMIQGGDPRGDGTGGETYKGPGTMLKDEFSPDLKNIRGALSMANRGPNTGSSQFFIVQKKGGTPWLDGKHAVFGQVVEGMDVVDAIAGVEVDVNSKPKTKVEMVKVEIKTKE